MPVVAGQISPSAGTPPIEPAATASRASHVDPVTVAAAPAPAAAVAEPISAPAPAPAPRSTEPRAPGAVAGQPAAQPASVAATTDSADVLGNHEFAALDSGRYTLELANAPTAAPLRALAARLNLPGAVYLIHLRNPDADRWLLAWSDHASQAEARAARLLVPADAAINSAWPRRLAPLQNELVSP